MRERSLDERYKRVLPSLLGVGNPAGKQWWQVLRRGDGSSAIKEALDALAATRASRE
jgi:hypothetical protein